MRLLPHVKAVLQEYARRDSRIKIVLRAENGHISAATNSALACASSTFFALLDHDDELSPHALMLVCRVAYAQYRVKVISDHGVEDVFHLPNESNFP